MHVTTTYLGKKRHENNYLFFLLTERYITENVVISESLEPLLTEFALKLGSNSTLVTPGPGYEEATLGNALAKGWSDEQIRRMRSQLPALLVTDVDFDNFDPDHSNYLLIFLRDSINEYGDVRIFELQELLDVLAKACQSPNLFQIANNYIADRDSKRLWEAVELKPGWLGLTFDLKSGVEFLRTIWNRQMYSST